MRNRPMAPPPTGTPEMTPQIRGRRLESARSGARRRWPRALRDPPYRAPVRQPLEADKAGERCHANDLAVPFVHLCALGNGVVVERRQAASHNVDDAVTAVDPQIRRAGDVLGRQALVVMESPCVHTLEKTQHGCVGVGAVWDKQVAGLGRADVAVVGDAEAADYDILEPDCVRVGDDAAQVRTSRLARGHGRHVSKRRAAPPPAGRASGPVRSAGRE